MTIEFLIAWLLCMHASAHEPGPGVPTKVTTGGSPDVGRLLLKV